MTIYQLHLIVAGTAKIFQAKCKSSSFFIETLNSYPSKYNLVLPSVPKKGTSVPKHGMATDIKNLLCVLKSNKKWLRVVSLSNHI